MDGVRRTKCPLCGGEIIISDLCQYSHEYRLTKAGKISKKCKKEDNGPMDVSVTGCKCGANWDADQFEITAEGFFIDYKYREEE